MNTMAYINDEMYLWKSEHQLSHFVKELQDSGLDINDKYIQLNMLVSRYASTMMAQRSSYNMTWLTPL